MGKKKYVGRFARAAVGRKVTPPKPPTAAAALLNKGDRVTTTFSVPTAYHGLNGVIVSLPADQGDRYGVLIDGEDHPKTFLPVNLTKAAAADTNDNNKN